MRPLSLKTQLEVRDEIESVIGDTGNSRWDAETIYRAINVGLRGWGNKVFIPQLYDMPSGFSSGVHEYTIPSYVGDNFRPYIKAAITNDHGIVLSVDTTYTWDAITGWAVEPDGDGGRKLRLHASPYTDDGRLIWYGKNGSIPLTVPALNAEHLAAATTVVLSSAVQGIGETGYIKIEGEWKFYAGVTRGASTTTLSNIVPALYGTTAATHASGVNVYWGIAVDDEQLWTQLEDAAIARLHYGLLHRGTTEDRSNHERIMGYAADQAKRFWSTSGYTPYAETRIKLNTGWR